MLLFTKAGILAKFSEETLDLYQAKIKREMKAKWGQYGSINVQWKVLAQTVPLNNACMHQQQHGSILSFCMYACMHVCIFLSKYTRPVYKILYSITLYFVCPYFPFVSLFFLAVCFFSFFGQCRQVGKYIIRSFK